MRGNRRFLLRRDRGEALRQFGAAVAEYAGVSGTLRFEDWEQAVDAALALATQQPVPVVLDEFPYLAREAGELPSVLQKALSPRRPQRRASKARLLLCGSSISFMGNLLVGAAPLRGRAGLEMVVPTFDFRCAADFWGIARAGAQRAPGRHVGAGRRPGPGVR